MIRVKEHKTAASGSAWHPPDVRSLFSQARKALKYLSAEVIDLEGGKLGLRCREKDFGPWKWKRMAWALKEAREDRRLRQLMECSDQGHSFPLISQDKASSSWIKNGKYLSFAEMRFALKGRLNLLPCRVVAKRTGRRHQTPGVDDATDSLRH